MAIFKMEVIKLNFRALPETLELMATIPQATILYVIKLPTKNENSPWFIVQHLAKFQCGWSNRSWDTICLVTQQLEN